MTLTKSSVITWNCGNLHAQKCIKYFRRYLSFQDLNINMKLTRILRNKEIRQPSDIQAKAIQCLLAGKNAVLNSETGSGKTLAYALPMVNKVQEIKRKVLTLPIPYGLVVVPTTELQYQVGNVFRRLLGANVCIANENSPLRLLDTEVVVSTPTFLMTYPLDVFKQVQTVVFDEADIMIAKKIGKHGRKDPLFNLIRQLIDPSHFQCVNERSKRQFIFVGATMPDNESRKSKFAMCYIRSWVPDITLIRSENVHKIIPNVDATYIKVLEGNKLKCLVQTLKEFPPLQKLRVLAFVNRVDSAASLYHSLTQFNYSALGDDYPVEGDNFLDDLRKFHLGWDGNIHIIHKNISLHERFEIFNRFSTSQQSILITTDIAARGLDFPDVDLVIQYDFATNVIDVLHRTGRTGRMGKEGKVVNFITEKDEILSNSIQQFTDEGNSLDSLFSRNRSLKRKMNRAERRSENLIEEDIDTVENIT